MGKEVSCVDIVQQTFDYQREIEENQKRIRKMVLESFHDIAAEKGRDCNEFLRNWKEELNKGVALWTWRK